MKKKIITMLVGIMAFSMVTACTSKNNDSKKEDSQVSTSQTEEGSDVSDNNTADTEKDTADDKTADASADDAENNTDDSNTTSDNEAEDTKADSDVSIVADAAYDYTVKMDVTNVDFSVLNGLDNTSINYGFNVSNRDELNRPDGIYYYDTIYGENGGMTHIDTEDKTVYLTMDEGYENGCTPTILDTLKEKNVKAVFFITKQFYDEQPALIQRMIDEGHIIGNHTCAHPAGGMPQLGAQAEYEDIKWLNDAVYDKYGYQMRLFRYPEGVSSKQSIALLNQMGYKSIFWSFAYKDFDLANQMDTSVALSQCVDQVHPGAIYLLHAVSTTNTAILGDFIDQVRAKGYEFGTFPVTVE